MAKGRRLTTSQSDRLLGFGNYNYGQDHRRDEPEFDEEEVWSMAEESRDHRVHHHQRGAYGGEWASRASGENRRTRHPQQQLGGLSLAFDGNTTSSGRIMHQFAGNGGGGGGGSRGGRHVAASAPVNVPDWGKILRVDSIESMHESDEDGDSGMEPPHEYLARSRKMNARSVYEGVGRTLKGRDMSRVRDQVWSQTGFEG